VHSISCYQSQTQCYNSCAFACIVQNLFFQECHAYILPAGAGRMYAYLTNVPYLYFYMSIYMSICLSIYMSICSMSICISDQCSLHPPVYQLVVADGHASDGLEQPDAQGDIRCSLQSVPGRHCTATDEHAKLQQVGVFSKVTKWLHNLVNCKQGICSP
jgi:hypothetical protein